MIKKHVREVSKKRGAHIYRKRGLCALELLMTVLSFVNEEPGTTGSVFRLRLGRKHCGVPPGKAQRNEMFNSVSQLIPKTTFVCAWLLSKKSQ